MNFNNNLYKIGKNLIDKEKNFNRKYNRLYEGHKTISKDHYILRHAFNILDSVKNENNEIDPKEYLQEGRKEKYKFNIYNFESAMKSNNKTKKLYSLDDEILKIMLSKINRKNIEEQIKKKEEKYNFQSLSLKGIKKKNSFLNTFNTTNSIKSYSGYILNKSNDISNKGYKTTSYNNIDNIKKFSIKYEPPTKFYYYNLNNRLKNIFQNINSKEKNILEESDFIKTDFKRTFKKNNNNKLKSKTINTETIRRPKIIIKNVDKIKKKKDLETLLFKDNEHAFNKIKKRLYSLYKYPKLKIKID